MQGCPHSTQEAQNRDDDDEKHIQPIEMLMPVAPSDGHLTDMRRLARHLAQILCQEWLI